MFQSKNREYFVANRVKQIKQKLAQSPGWKKAYGKIITGDSRNIAYVKIMQVAKEKGDLSIALTLDEYTSKKSFQIPSLFQNSETPESDISKI